jgi:hypothetical protein
MDSEPLAKILVVDDETAHLRALCDTLREHRYAVTGCASGEKALRAIAAAKFDLVLTDLMMPCMDGIATIRAATQRDPDLVGIVMTGQGTIETAVEAMKAGAFDYIQKPFRVSVILPALARALEMRRLRMENTALAQRVAARTRELEVINEELESFSYSVSHDLRAPLRNIQGYVELLGRPGAEPLPDKPRAQVGEIGRAATEMEALIGDLLAFSRMARTALMEQAVALEPLVRDAIGALGPETGGRDIEWLVAPLPTVRGDAAMLKLVFVNLLGNAAKYSRPRAVARIEVGTGERDDGRPSIYVRDNGVGFDPQYARKLFGVFQRLHGAEAFEGTGLGLATVRRIVSRHGGRAWAESAPDRGATFYVSLPEASDA